MPARSPHRNRTDKIWLGAGIVISHGSAGEGLSDGRPKKCMRCGGIDVEIRKGEYVAIIGLRAPANPR